VRRPTNGARIRVAMHCPCITILHVNSEGNRDSAHEVSEGIEELTSAHTKVVCIIVSVQTQRDPKIGRATLSVELISASSVDRAGLFLVRV
jgi:hypothetical protein